ncbi:MAG TPA: twin-arginine translocation signal domain-containing protein [Gemmata sp.]|nr:twin-arginine translocation signal domain-containing protein [Gemmata sp.]
MANTNRRRFLKGILGAVAGAAGAVVLASTANAAESTGDKNTPPQPETPADIQERAEKLATADGGEVPVSAFLNGGWRNAIGGGFRNGGFANGFGGGFRNGGFRNGVGGGFRNGAFRNW